MTKTASGDLHYLIHSLMGTEKRYFKIYTSRHTLEGGNKYVRLFDAIVKLKRGMMKTKS